MTYKYEIGDRVQNKNGKWGLVTSKVFTDDGDRPAYVINPDNGGNNTRWSEARLVDPEQPKEVIKKGTTFRIHKKLSEGGIEWNPGDTFTQQEDNITPKYKDHIYGEAWHHFFEIVEKEEEQLFNKGVVWKCTRKENKPGKSVGYYYGHYYLQREDGGRDKALSVLDAKGSPNNGYTGSASNNAQIVKTKTITKWERDSIYMCIENVNSFGEFTKGKTYKTIDKGNIIKIVGDDKDDWNLDNDKDKFLKIVDDGSKPEPIPEAPKEYEDVYYKIPYNFSNPGDAFYKEVKKVIGVTGNNIYDSYLVFKDGEFSKEIITPTGCTKRKLPTDIKTFKEEIADLRKGKKKSSKKKEYTIDDLSVDMKIKLKKKEDLPDGHTGFPQVQASWVDGMKEYVGTIVTVKMVHSSNFEIEGCSWNYSTDMIEYIIDEEKSSKEEWEASWGDDEPAKEVPEPQTGGDVLQILKKDDVVHRVNNGKTKHTGIFVSIDKSQQPYIKVKSSTDSANKSTWDANNIIKIERNGQTIWVKTKKKTKEKSRSEQAEWEIPSAPKPKPKEYIDKPIKDEIKQMLPVFPVLLEGPVGSGKTTIATEICEELGLDLLGEVMTRQTTLSMLMGYKNVNGDYIPSKLRDAYENGKFYLLEELNGGDPNTLLAINTIENGFLLFPDGLIKQHPNFRMMATMNDITNAKDFGGRSNLDLSTKNRFHTIYVPANPGSRFSKETTKIGQLVDEILSKAGISSKTTNRDLMRYEHMMKDQDQLIAIKKCLIINKTTVTNSQLEKIIKDSKNWE